MRWITMGPDEKPTVMFIHGLSATAVSCYGKVAERLADRWHILLCELDGHYDGSADFSGLDDACAQIEAYVTAHHAGCLSGLVGLSLGGTIAVSLLGRGRIRVEKTVLDAAFCVDMGPLRGIYGWVFPECVMRVRDGKPIPGFLMDLFLGKGNRSLVEMIYPGITRETCRRACREVYAYRIPEGLGQASPRVAFWRGSREPYPRSGAALLRAYLPGMTERVFPDRRHCQFLHEEPERYAELLDRELREKA